MPYSPERSASSSHWSSFYRVRKQLVELDCLLLENEDKPARERLTLVFSRLRSKNQSKRWISALECPSDRGRENGETYTLGIVTAIHRFLHRASPPIQPRSTVVVEESAFPSKPTVALSPGVTRRIWTALQITSESATRHTVALTPFPQGLRQHVVELSSCKLRDAIVTYGGQNLWCDGG